MHMHVMAYMHTIGALFYAIYAYHRCSFSN